MRRFLTLLCAVLTALAASQAEASITTTGAGKVPAGGGGGGYTGPIDAVGTSVTHCYALRACSATWADGTHAAVHLVRADTHTCAVLLNTSGNLANTTACSNTGENGTDFKLWCASTTCKVDIWYDQLALDDGSTGTSALQPVLMWNDGTNCLGIASNLPCIHFNGSNVLPTTSATVGPPVSVAAVARRTGAFTAYNAIISGANGVYFNTAANGAVGFFGTFMTVASATDSTWHELSYISVNASSSSGISVDGTVTATAGALSNGLDSAFIGGSSSTPGNPLTGDISEIEVYSAAITFATGSGQSNTLCHNQRLYWGNTGSC